jgi:hypothetical protein
MWHWDGTHAWEVPGLVPSAPTQQVLEQVQAPQGVILRAGTQELVDEAESNKFTLNTGWAGRITGTVPAQ